MKYADNKHTNTFWNYIINESEAVIDRAKRF